VGETFDDCVVPPGRDLAMLRQRGVVKTRRDGPNIYYGISNPKIVKAYSLIREVLLERLQKDQSIMAEIRNE
jgi:hypothetical protein